jgi:hypothetical protein
MKNNFDYFIGIDWSGAKGSSHKGIAVAISSDKNNLIEIVNPKKSTGVGLKYLNI